MKKKLSLFFAVLLLANTVFASGQKESEENGNAPETLNIIGHSVHKRIVTEGAGGDIQTPWVNENPLVSDVTWNTLDIGPLHDRLFREATLPETKLGVAYLLNTYAMPKISNLLEPLNGYLKDKPIEGFEESFGKGTLGSLTFDGKLYGVPVRAAVHGLGYNEGIFRERGIAGPPTTPEEFYEIVKQCTYKREDGTQVYGFIQQSGYYYTGVTSLARMWDGDFINSDYEVVCNQEPMVNAIKLLRKMYVEGLIPQNTPSIKHAEVQRMLQQGTVAMVFDVVGKIYSFNDEAAIPELKVTTYPMDKSISSKYEYGPSATEFWSMVIPRNSTVKEQAWDYIRHISSADSALKMAMSGNGPARNSVFLDPAYLEEVPYGQIVYNSALNARVPLPAFDKTPQAMVLIDNYIEKALFGEMEPQAAMDELAVKLIALSSSLKY